MIRRRYQLTRLRHSDWQWCNRLIQIIRWYFNFSEDSFPHARRRAVCARPVRCHSHWERYGAIDADRKWSRWNDSCIIAIAGVIIHISFAAQAMPGCLISPAWGHLMMLFLHANQSHCYYFKRNTTRRGPWVMHVHINPGAWCTCRCWHFISDRRMKRTALSNIVVAIFAWDQRKNS